MSNNSFHTFHATNGNNANSNAIAAAPPPPPPPPPSKPDPVTVQFTVGNTYTRLSPSEASYDKLTGRHLKIHDWSLYVDVLPGYDPDIIDRVTFDMRDDSYANTAFTCHCPIRLRNLGKDGSIMGRLSNNNDTKAQQLMKEGQGTKEEGTESYSSLFASSSNSVTCSDKSRWRFSTRQQTYGPVDVEITIRGRGGCRCTVPYRVVLAPGGHECHVGSLPVFIEKRPYQSLKPLKMMDGSFWVTLNFGLNASMTSGEERRSNNNTSLHYKPMLEIAKSVYSRSKIPIRLILESGNSINGVYRTEEFGFANKPSAPSIAWTLSQNTLDTAGNNATLNSFSFKEDDDSSQQHAIISISSPVLIGGHGLNECYKIIEGLPSTGIISNTTSFVPNNPLVGSVHVQIDASTLSLQQIIKVCQNFIKYEEAMDSFMPWSKREDRCKDCCSNKQAVDGSTNKQRNIRISKCATLEELVQCMDPIDGRYYKLNLRKLILQNNQHHDHCASSPMIEFRQHTSSTDKTTVTHWIRFCMAFVRNSARLRAPSALKATTSIEEEFDLLFEYVVKDRALRKFYVERRDTFIEEEERELNRNAMESFKIISQSTDGMSLDGSEKDGSPVHLPSIRRRDDTIDGVAAASKRPCI